MLFGLKTQRCPCLHIWKCTQYIHNYIWWNICTVKEFANSIPYSIEEWRSRKKRCSFSPAFLSGPAKAGTGLSALARRTRAAPRRNRRMTRDAPCHGAPIPHRTPVIHPSIKRTSKAEPAVLFFWSSLASYLLQYWAPAQLTTKDSTKPWSPPGAGPNKMPASPTRRSSAISCFWGLLTKLPMLKSISLHYNSNL